VPLILVMGHSGCGAVQAALGHRTLSPLQEELVAPIRACLRPGDDLSRAVEANALDTASRLTARSALLRRASASGRLQIQSAVFDIGSGVVSLV
jgi:carbonic anhydrase